MTQPTADDENEQQRAVSVPRALAAMVRQARDRRGWSGEQLAERCAQAGMDSLDRSTIANIENGRRRRIGVDEWLVLAHVLNVAPLHLLLPRDDDDLVGVTPAVTVNAAQARRWVTGREPLPGSDEATYRFEVPRSEHDRRTQRVRQAEEEADAARRRLRVAQEKLRQLSEERGRYDEPDQLLKVATPATPEKARSARLDRLLDVAYDEVAEAKVSYEDAVDRLRRVQREEGSG
jgi:transcriptional regulator with XRE-family HTH domain